MNNFRRRKKHKRKNGEALLTQRMNNFPLLNQNNTKS